MKTHDVKISVAVRIPRYKFIRFWYLPLTGCQLDFVKKKVFLKGLIFKRKGFCNKKKGFPCQMDSFLIPAKGFFTTCILK